MPKLQAVERLLREVRKHLDRNAIGEEDCHLLVHSEVAGSDRAADAYAAAVTAFRPDGSPETPDLKALRRGLERLATILQIKLATSLLDSSWKVALGRVQSVFSALLLGFVSYMVVGGILAGHAFGEKGPHPFIALGFFFALIGCLGAFEGMHISVVTLRLKDLTLSAKEYASAAKHHDSFRTVEGTDRFLAGRQLFVIVTVFLTAQITTFSKMNTWPGTSIPFPSWTPAIVRLVLLDLGVLGALFVLWIGQLVPQFIANRNPQGFLNLPGMGGVLFSSVIVDRLGLTRPGYWLSNWAPSGPFIRTSPEELYRLEAEDVRGYGSITLKKNWTIGKTGADLVYLNAIEFHRCGFHSIKDYGLRFQGASTATSFLYVLTGKTGGTRPVYANRVEDDRASDGWRTLVQKVGPSIGAFSPGDVLQSEARLRFSSALIDQTLVFSPTRRLLFRIKFIDSPEHIGRITVQGFKWDEAIGQSTPFLERELMPRTENGFTVAEFSEMYPIVGSYYQFQWDVEY